MQRKQNSSSLSLEPHFRALCSLMMGSVIILLACFALCGRTCHLDFPSWFCWHPALESVLLRVLQREIRWLIWLCFTGNTHLQGRTSTLLFYSLGIMVSLLFIPDVIQIVSFYKTLQRSHSYLRDPSL